MKEIITALITPFTKNGDIDYDSLQSLILQQYEQVDGFVVCGTTAESATLSTKEKVELLQFVIRMCKKEKQVIFGCGSASTQVCIELIERVEAFDFDALLIVTPYYNKPSQNGLYHHYKKISQHTNKKIILYQVESRCQVSFSLKTLQKLYYECKNIVGLKYASSNLQTLKEIRKMLIHFKIYCGSDDLIVEMNPYTNGVISVISQLNAPLIRRYYESNDTQYNMFILRYAKLCFIEGNPASIKYILSIQGRCKPYLRLPLYTLEDENKRIIDSYFDNFHTHTLI